KSDKCCPKVSVKEAVHWILAPQKVQPRFEVCDDLRITKDGEAEMRRCCCFERSGRAEMKWRKWHEMRVDLTTKAQRRRTDKRPARNRSHARRSLRMARRRVHHSQAGHG